PSPFTPFRICRSERGPRLCLLTNFSFRSEPGLTRISYLAPPFLVRGGDWVDFVPDPQSLRSLPERCRLRSSLQRWPQECIYTAWRLIQTSGGLLLGRPMHTRSGSSLMTRPAE